MMTKIKMMVILLLLTYSTELFGQTSTEIITQMEDVMLGESSYVEMTMRIERPRYTRDVSMKSWALGNDYSLILITAPARDQGTSFLKRDNEIWNYVPSIDRTIKMPPSMMAQSWMGSDFTNDDLVRETSMVDDFDHKILREEEYNGYQSWVLELIPKPDTPVVWGKVLVWVSKDGYLQLKVENYDQNNELANTMLFDDIKEMGGRTIPSKMTLVPADKPDQKTELIYSKMEFSIEIEESFFSQQNMRRIR